MGLTFTRLRGVTLDSRACHDLTLACVPRNTSADNRLTMRTVALVAYWLVCLPLDAKVAGLNPAKAMNF
jgi:hypothetical protein